MGMWDFLKGKGDNEDKKIVEGQAKEESQETKGSDEVVHAMDTPEAVPQALKDKLAEIRGEQGPDYVEVELNEDGTPVNPEHAELLKTGSVVKDDESIGGDADDSEKGESQETDEAEANDSSDLPEVVVIPSRLMDAGKTLGWDEAKISRIAAADVTILEDLASRLEESQTHRQTKDGKDGASDSTEGQTESPALTKLREKLGDEADEVLKTIVDGVKVSFKPEFDSIEKFKKDQIEKTEIDESHHRARISDEVFDMASKRFPEIGKSEEITKTEEGDYDLDAPEMKVRGKIYADALMFQQARGGSFEVGLRDALQYYAGGTGQDRAVRQVVKDANDNKKRFTVKPNRRKTVRVFMNPDDKKKHIVQEAKRKAGLDA
ncbi:MAG: hypothetical protein ACXABY_27830 [Candidatus Thorarchaeota archaeon]|jgi:hypothetical protein